MIRNNPYRTEWNKDRTKRVQFTAVGETHVQLHITEFLPSTTTVIIPNTPQYAIDWLKARDIDHFTRPVIMDPMEIVANLDNPMRIETKMVLDSRKFNEFAQLFSQMLGDVYAEVFTEMEEPIIRTMLITKKVADKMEVVDW